MWELATATLSGVVVAGAAMLLRDDMLGKSYAREVETRLRLTIADLQLRQQTYEADFKSILKEISELKGMLVARLKEGV